MSEVQGKSAAKFLGSLRQALAAASRSEASQPPMAFEPAKLDPPIALQAVPARDALPLTAVEAAREARGGTPHVPPLDDKVEIEMAPTTRIVRQAPPLPAGSGNRTQIVRGKNKVVRGEFLQDPVVGWLVVVGGPGLGAYRPIFEGNNSLGRSITQRVPIDFGDEAISAEEQAFIRYDSSERSFLFVPNMTKTNVVSINDKRPTAAVTLAAMDVITMGRTQLVFVPFCGTEFDWSELPDIKI